MALTSPSLSPWRPSLKVLRLALLAGAAGSSAAAEAAPLIPLCPGFTLVTSIGQSEGDYESIKTIESIDAEKTRIRYSSEHMAYDLLGGEPATLKRTLTYRNVLTADTASASLYLQYFDEVLPETVPETTAISISRTLLQALKDTGSADFGIFIPFNVDRPSIDRDTHPNVYDNQMVATVTRTDNPPPMAVTVNNVETRLPVIRFEGDFYGDKSEFFVLDDPENPLMLKFRIGIDANQPLTEDEIAQRKLLEMPTSISPDKETLQVVKIIAPCAASVEEVPDGKADVPPGGDGKLPDVEIAGGGDAADGGAAGPANAPPADTPPPPPPPPPPPAAETPVAVESAAIEKEIEDDGRAEIQSIFFSFNSDVIRDESRPTLSAIAALMERHPDWRLSLEGHTDSVGDDAYNLDLSKRRAAAVVVALAKQFKVAAGRLESAGFGEARPVADNATLEGRARNRRVELVKLP